MKSKFLKIRISADVKTKLDLFSDETGLSVSELVRQSIEETIKGQVAGLKRREDIAKLRRSTNLMLALFETRPIDVPKLKIAANEVRFSATRVLA